MSDLIERLRRPQLSPATQGLCAEAAAEIERLSALLTEVQRLLLGGCAISTVDGLREFCRAASAFLAEKEGER